MASSPKQLILIEPQYDQALYKSALDLWCPGADVKIVSFLGGGFSGANVLLIDIEHEGQQSANHSLPESLKGLYVLKLDSHRPRDGKDVDEAERLSQAINWSPEFAKRHMPTLERKYRAGERLALLYEIAGKSFTRLVRTDLLDVGPLENRLRIFSDALLTKFNSNLEVSHNTTVGQMLSEWLKHRLEPKSPIRELAESVTEGRRAFVHSFHILPNPLELAGNEIGGKSLNAVFRGMLHGDLHRDNVFWDRPPESQEFWLIDFAFSRQAALFFDHAYFELSLLLNHFSGADPARLLSLLAASLYSEGQLGARFVAPADEGIRAVIAAFRSGITRWQQEQQPSRADSVKAQWCLGRVGAGLYFANRQLDPPIRFTAFCYAAHAVKEYLDAFEPEVWRQWSKDIEPRIAHQNFEAAKASDNAWQALWTEMGGFSSLDYFVLLAGPLGDSEDLAAVGLLPWSVVLDFDPESDQRGLLKLARPNLDQERSVHLFGRQVAPVSVVRGTAWMMALGSKALNEPTPQSLAEWRPLYKESVRALAAEIRAQSAPAMVRILVVPGQLKASDFLKRALEETVDELGPNRRVIVAVQQSEQSLWNLPEVDRVIDLPSEELSRRIRTIFGVTKTTSLATVPGLNGHVELDAQKLRNFEEDFEILHTSVLAKCPTDDGQAFWRGGPPSWRDLETQVPVPRSVVKKLVTELQTKLKHKEHRASKVELFHTPGAGGTTVALAAAWNLRQENPTAVLRMKSRNTADRVSWLFHLSGLPVLLVADPSVLSRAELDDLLLKVANENARVVVLHVIRVSQRVDHEPSIYDPMSSQEANDFAASFSRQTRSHEKAALLRQIATSQQKDFESLRSPFFFGLVTFEKEFTHLPDYVSHHLADATYVERKLLYYLSLVAAFSQAVLSPALVRRLINLDPTDQRPLVIVLSPGPARLVVEWGKMVKLVHPMLAEEILRQYGGGEERWKLSLNDLAIDFAKEVLQAAGGYTDEVAHVFRNLFIDREDWSMDDISTRRELFSPLLERIPSNAARGRLLEVLTELCPNDPHFWNHRGRHCAYSDTPNYKLAEDFLLKAISLSDGKDPIHHHGLGMVRRLWGRSIARDFAAKAAAEGKSPSPDGLFQQLKPHVDGALAEFAESRKLNPEDAHGYITAIQTVLFVAEELTKFPGHTFSSLSKDNGSVGNWLRAQIATAEQLLARLARVRGPGSESSYEITCMSKLAKLYGNFELIKTWESMLDQTSEPQHLRRAIASLYFARRQRRWSSLEPKELRRISKLTEDNLRSDPTEERDLRLWFQATRRLPEFNYYEAIERLQAWAAGGDTVDAYYYLYVLNYLRWQAHGDDAEEIIMANINKCAERRRGTRGYSYEWLAREPRWCPLISDRDVGDWDRQRNFFSDPRRLSLAQGTIETIKPQAGSIRLGRLLRAFFVPPVDIREASHINATVHFYLGFSYEGPRAWGVQLGETPENKPIDDKKSLPEGKTPIKLWIGGIPHHFKELDLRALFEPFGKVNQVDIPLSPIKSGNRGFGFVVMASMSDAQRAIQSLHGSRSQLGKRFQVREAD